MRSRLLAKLSASAARRSAFVGATRMASSTDSGQSQPPPGIDGVLQELGVDPAQWRNRALLAPLATTDFHFHRHHYHTVGDTIVKQVCAQQIFDYTSRHNSVVTPNATAQALAILHNTVSLRLLCERVGLAQCSMPNAGWGMGPGVEGGAVADETDPTMEQLFPIPPATAPYRHDVYGTAFEHVPHRFEQSGLGARLAHLIGCIAVDQSTAAAEAAVRRLFGMDSGAANVPWLVATTLQQMMQRFPPSTVAAAILAAQGYTTEFIAETKRVPTPPAKGGSPASGSPGHGSDDGMPDGETIFNPPPQLSVTVTGETPSGSSEAAQYETETTLQQEWRVHEGLPPTAIPHGWLDPHAQQGPAFAAAPVMPSGLSDSYGTPLPQNGRLVSSKNHGKAPVEDAESFFSERAMGQEFKGVPINTPPNVTVSEYVRSFSAPHRNAVSVTLVVQQTGAVVGSGTSTRYTAARVMACKEFLVRVAHDVESFGHPIAAYVGDEQRAHEAQGGATTA